MNILLKLLSWLKNNWFIVILIGSICYLLWNQFSLQKDYAELLNSQDQSFNKQITNLEKLNRDWQQKQEKLNEFYNGELKRIEEQYKIDLKSISEKKKIFQNKIVKESENDPNVLPDLFEKTFGIKKYEGQQ